MDYWIGQNYKRREEEKETQREPLEIITGEEIGQTEHVSAVSGLLWYMSWTTRP